jgi:hypothetical protein
MHWSFGGKKGAYKYRPSRVVNVRFAGENTVKDGTDAADFADSFVSNMNDAGLTIHYNCLSSANTLLLFHRQLHY